MKTILVVDNHPVTLKLLVGFLKKQGHEVLPAEDGLAALEILKTARPDIVFTDLIMPNINGEKLCQIIRSRAELKQLPIIIYSATVLEDETNILNLGADACIAKGPFKNTEKHIVQVIEHIDNGTLQELKGKVLGGEDLYKRHITTELLFSRRHYEVIFNSMPEGIVEFTLNGAIFHANAAALALCGLREEHLLASSFFELFSGEDQERLRPLLHASGPAPLIIDEAAPIRLNGRMITIHFLPSNDETHAFIIAIMRDLTEKSAPRGRLTCCAASRNASSMPLAKASSALIPKAASPLSTRQPLPSLAMNSMNCWAATCMKSSISTDRMESCIPWKTARSMRPARTALSARAPKPSGEKTGWVFLSVTPAPRLWKTMKSWAR